MVPLDDVPLSFALRKLLIEFVCLCVCKCECVNVCALFEIVIPSMKVVSGKPCEDSAMAAERANQPVSSAPRNSDSSCSPKSW